MRKAKSESIFHWKYTSVLGITIWFAGLGAVFSDRFNWALGLFLVGGLWLAAWGYCEKPIPSIGRYAGIVPILITIVFSLFNEHLRTEHDLTQHSGVLYPGDYPNPGDDPCGLASENGIAIFGGTNVYHAEKFPQVVLRINDDDLLVLDRDKQGRLFVTTRLFDDQGEVIAKIPTGPESGFGYWIRPDSRMYRKDESSLTVYDRRDKEVLSLTFLNPHALLIRGVFRASDSPGNPVVISDSRVIDPFGNLLHGQCFSNDVDLYFGIRPHP